VISRGRQTRRRVREVGSLTAASLTLLFPLVLPLQFTARTGEVAGAVRAVDTPISVVICVVVVVVRSSVHRVPAAHVVGRGVAQDVCVHGGECEGKGEGGRWRKNVEISKCDHMCGYTHIHTHTHTHTHVLNADFPQLGNGCVCGPREGTWRFIAASTYSRKCQRQSR